MQDLNWEVVSAIRANRKKAQEPIYITKNLFLYIIARYRSCGEAYWRGRRALKDDHGPRHLRDGASTASRTKPSTSVDMYLRHESAERDEHTLAKPLWQMITGRP